MVVSAQKKHTDSLLTETVSAGGEGHHAGHRPLGLWTRAFLEPPHFSVFCCSQGDGANDCNMIM